MLAIAIAALWLVLIGAVMAGALITHYLWAQILPPQPDLPVPIQPGWPPSVATMFMFSVLTAGIILIIITRLILSRVMEHVLPPE